MFCRWVCLNPAGASEPAVVGSYLWLLRDVEAGVSGPDADEPLGWRCGGGGVRCTEDTEVSEEVGGALLKTGRANIPSG